MNFVQIEAFVAVIRYRSFSKAAEAIYLSQPTISSHIRSLENELGVQLLIRSTKEIYPSAAGRIFYGYASEMISMRDKAVSEVKSYSTKIQGSLEIAASSVPSAVPPWGMVTASSRRNSRPERVRNTVPAGRAVPASPLRVMSHRALVPGRRVMLK